MFWIALRARIVDVSDGVADLGQQRVLQCQVASLDGGKSCLAHQRRLILDTAVPCAYVHWMARMCLRVVPCVCVLLWPPRIYDEQTPAWLEHAGNLRQSLSFHRVGNLVHHKGT